MTTSASSVPPIPYNTPIQGRGGLLTTPWNAWFRQLLLAVGGGGGGSVTFPIPIQDGGTGVSTQQAAINALTGAQTARTFLRSDGTNAKLSAIQALDVPTLNQNTTGTASNITGNLLPTNLDSGDGANSDSFWRGDGVWADPFGNSGDFTIANNQSSPADVSGLLFDGASILSFEIDYQIYRNTSGSGATELSERGKLLGVYSSSAGTWEIENGPAVGNAGLLFSITSGGQVQYKSSDITGTAASSDLKFSYTTMAMSPATAFTIANNQSSPADISGLLFSGSTFRSFETDYQIYRDTTGSGATELAERGKLIGVFSTVASTWEIAPAFAVGNSGVAFSITSSGQIQYTSTNITGTASVSEMNFTFSTIGV